MVCDNSICVGNSFAIVCLRMQAECQKIYPEFYNKCGTLIKASFPLEYHTYTVLAKTCASVPKMMAAIRGATCPDGQGGSLWSPTGPLLNKWSADVPIPFKNARL